MNTRTTTNNALDLVGLARGKPKEALHSAPPAEADISRLEKIAWDAHVEHVVIWYRDHIERLRERVRETEQALKIEADRRIAAEQMTWKRAARLVAHYTGRDLDALNEEFNSPAQEPTS